LWRNKEAVHKRRPLSEGRGCPLRTSGKMGSSSQQVKRRAQVNHKESYWFDFYIALLTLLSVEHSDCESVKASTSITPQGNRIQVSIVSKVY